MKISGKVVLSPPLTSVQLPSGSCVRVNVKEEILCELPDCNIPNLAESTDKNPQLNKDGSYSYELKLEKKDSFYRLNLEAVVNIGWCDVKNSLRSGDYLNKDAHMLELKKDKNNYEKDISVELYKKSSIGKSASCFL